MTNRGGAPEEPLAGEDAAAAEPAVLHGFLTDVNLSARTARLRDMDGGFAGLIYGAALDGSARRLEERYVTVRGSGRFGPGGDWLAVRAESFEGDRSMREPFDREAFLREPNPKIRCLGRAQRWAWRGPARRPALSPTSAVRRG